MRACLPLDIWRPCAFHLKLTCMIYGLADRKIRARQWLQDQATQLSQFAAPHLTLKQQPA